MPQVTIYLDDTVMKLVNAAVKASGVSKSRWIADAAAARAAGEWPQSVRDLAGSWRDAPTTGQIRKKHGTGSIREKL
jgi:hypothetical protein